jgi:signal recognition particle subunit SRP54
LLKNYLQMQKMMKAMSKGGGLRRLMGAFGGGRFPPG